jgi:hypothetical protein
MAQPTLHSVKLMSDEDVAAANRELKKKIIRNFLIFAGLKAATYYAIHRLAKAAREAQ